MDSVLTRIGEFGTYQKRKFALLSIQFCMSAVFLYSVLYILGDPPHRCKIDSDDEYAIRNEYHNKSVRNRIPLDDDGVFKPCAVYVDSDRTTEGPCHSFVYDMSEVGRTLTTEFDLVCDKRQVAATITTMGFVGRLVGSLLIGVLSDRFGRKKTFVLAVIILAISCAASIAPNPYSYMVFRLIAGCCNIGAYSCAFVIIMEIVGPKRRTLISTLGSLIYTVGYLIVDGVAYLLRDWQFLAIFVTAPFVLLVFITIWLIPESPRWLLIMGRNAEARKVIDEAAAVNGAAFPDKEFSAASEQKEGEAKKSDFRDLVKNRTMLVRLILLIVLWFTVDMGYYGISLQAGYIFGGIYLNNALSALAEFPSFLLAYSSQKIGRKRATMVSILMGTAGLLCAGLLQFLSHGADTGYGILAATMFGKIGASSAYNLLYVWTVETVPTGYRNVVLGICSAASGVSTTIAPYIIQINTDKSSASQAIPSVLFGALLGLSSLAILPLPETSKESLPDDIEGAANLGQTKEDNAVIVNTYLELMAKEETGP